MVAESDGEEGRRQVRLRIHPERSTLASMPFSGRWEGGNHRVMLQGSGMVQRCGRFPGVIFSNCYFELPDFGVNLSCMYIEEAETGSGTGQPTCRCGLSL